jgi:hypothetical protein
VPPKGNPEGWRADPALPWTNASTKAALALSFHQPGSDDSTASVCARLILLHFGAPLLSIRYAITSELVLDVGEPLHTLRST